MELLIKANSADDLRVKILQMADQFSNAPRQLKMSVIMPTELPAQPKTTVAVTRPTPSNLEVLPPLTDEMLAGNSSEPVFGGADPQTIMTPAQSKAQKAASVKAAKAQAEAEAIAAAAELSQPPAQQGAWSRDDLANKIREVIAKCGPNVARELMNKNGWAHLGKIEESDFNKFMGLAHETLITKSKKAAK